MTPPLTLRARVVVVASGQQGTITAISDATGKHGRARLRATVQVLLVGEQEPRWYRPEELTVVLPAPLMKGIGP